MPKGDLVYEGSNIVEEYGETYPDGPKYFINGPGMSGRWSRHCFTPDRFATQELAADVAILLNIAYYQGMQAKERQLQKVLGLK